MEYNKLRRWALSNSQFLFMTTELTVQGDYKIIFFLHMTLKR